MLINKFVKILFSIALFTFNASAMQSAADKAFAESARSTARLALHVAGYKGNIADLEKISEKDITSEITVHRGPNAETYMTTLSNGDELVCDKFHGGPCKGTISCTRHVVIDYGRTVFLPVNNSLFWTLQSKVKSSVGRE